MEAVKKIQDKLPESLTNVTRVEFIKLDLSNLESVKSFAEEVNGKFDKIDILLNNAGLFTDVRKETKQGFEMNFGVNHLGHFVLTSLFMDKIKGVSPSHQGRIVNVTSLAHKGGKMHWEDLQLKKENSW